METAEASNCAVPARWKMRRVPLRSGRRSAAETPGRRSNRAVPHPAGTARPARRVDPAAESSSPPLPAGGAGAPCRRRAPRSPPTGAPAPAPAGPSCSRGCSPTSRCSAHSAAPSAELLLIAFVTAAAPVAGILTDLGESVELHGLPRPTDRPPGMISCNRGRTGTRWRNRHRSSSSISAFPGKHCHWSDTARHVLPRRRARWAPHPTLRPPDSAAQPLARCPSRG